MSTLELKGKEVRGKELIGKYVVARTTTGFIFAGTLISTDRIEFQEISLQNARQISYPYSYTSVEYSTLLEKGIVSGETTGAEIPEVALCMVASVSTPTAAAEASIKGHPHAD